MMSSVSGPLLPAHPRTESERNSANRRPLLFISTCHCTPVERIKKRGLLAPVGLDLNVKLQKNLHAEKLFHFLAGVGSYLLQHGAPRTDDDALLALAFHEYGGVDASDIGRLVPLIDQHGDRVRHLLLGLVKYLFADELGGQEALGLIGDVVLREIHWPF